MVQADSVHADSNEKVIDPIEMLKGAFSCLLDSYVGTYGYLDALSLLGLRLVPDFDRRAEDFNPVDALNALSARSSRPLNFSNDSESGAVSLKQNFSAQPNLGKE